MEFIDQIYEETSDIRDKLYNHPVIKAIENESLPIEKFKYYMIEDYLYLWDHLKVFAIGILKSKEHEQMRSFTLSLYNCLINEMDIHRKYMQDLDIDIKEVENKIPNIMTASYSNFRISKAIQGNYEEVSVILLACDLSYTNIIQKIKNNNPNIIENKIFGRWIRGYLDPIYVKEVNEGVKLLNKEGKNLSFIRKKEIIELFKTCLNYEIKFWDMIENEGN